MCHRHQYGHAPGPAAHGPRGRGRSLHCSMEQPTASCLPLRCHRIRPLDYRPGAPRARPLRVGRRRRPRTARCRLEPRRRAQSRVKPCSANSCTAACPKLQEHIAVWVQESAITHLARFNTLLELQVASARRSEDRRSHSFSAWIEPQLEHRSEKELALGCFQLPTELGISSTDTE
jgi:hypothetical protein